MSQLANKFMNRMFRRISGLVWDLSSGNIGVKTDNGIYTLTVEEGQAGSTSYGVTVNPFDAFGTAIPAYALQTAHADVQLGDLICGDSKIIGWVVEKTDKAFKVLDHNGNQKTYVPPKVAIIGQQGVLVVRSLLTMFGGGQGLAGFGNNLLPLLMMEGGESKLEKILPIMLMQGVSGGFGGAPAGQAGATPAAGGFNPMMLLAMGGLGDKSSGKGIDTKTLMMMSMFGGGAGAGGMNPMMMALLMGDGGLDGLFGGSAEVTAPAVTRLGPPPLTAL